ncbi:hypothetical protein [Myxococcus xanthus]|uniref:Uncharacterized protein n=1 Tax=Myxococcus xanthus TaxID=34 RepID=A0A7Y4IKV4_MYXXA|nr:hypothetical protein [Myxococcus xanthus]NOJ80660.1 hypothetical protein [Myxococcus xanthus]NOJ85866.1 hypothetical protein [Myxococcus xanthus]
MFTRSLDHGSKQLTWLRGTLGMATALAGAASEVGASGMELGILRMSGPRIQAEMFGTLLLATWGTSSNSLTQCFANAPCTASRRRSRTCIEFRASEWMEMM